MSFVFPTIHKMISTRIRVQIKSIRSNDGRECFFIFIFEMEGTILTTSCCPFLEKEGIVRQSFYTNTPKQKWKNRNKKRKKKTAKKSSRWSNLSLVDPKKKKNVSKTLWKGSSSKCNTLNQLPSSTLGNKTPVAIFFFLFF